MLHCWTMLCIGLAPNIPDISTFVSSVHNIFSLMVYCGDWINFCHNSDGLVYSFIVRNNFHPPTLPHNLDLCRKLQMVVQCQQWPETPDVPSVWLTASCYPPWWVFSSLSHQHGGSSWSLQYLCAATFSPLIVGGFDSVQKNIQCLQYSFISLPNWYFSTTKSLQWFSVKCNRKHSSKPQRQLTFIWF